MSKPHSPLVKQPQPLLIVLSGPSGAGKDAVLSRMKAQAYPLHYTVTMTTRRKRIKEENRVDYHFISESHFQEMRQKGELLECAQVYGHWYGVPKKQVRQAFSRGLDVIIKTDVQGAATIKRLSPQAVFIFLVPPSLEKLEKQLRQRNTEARFDLELRLRTAKAELKQMSNFDYVVINQPGAIEQAVSKIISIITAEKCRLKQRRVKL